LLQLHQEQDGASLVQPILKLENTGHGTESGLKSKDNSWQRGLIAVQFSLNNDAMPGDVSPGEMTDRKLQHKKQQERQREENNKERKNRKMMRNINM